MSAKPDNRRKNGPAIIGALLLIGPIFYALSSGPAALLVVHDYISADVFNTTYLPINWAYNHSPTPVQQAMQWYLELWVEHL